MRSVFTIFFAATICSSLTACSLDAHGPPRAHNSTFLRRRQLQRANIIGKRQVNHVHPWWSDLDSVFIKLLSLWQQSDKSWGGVRSLSQTGDANSAAVSGIMEHKHIAPYWSRASMRSNRAANAVVLPFKIWRVHWPRLKKAA